MRHTVIELTDEERDAVEYCLLYAAEKDDEGIRNSDDEAVARTEAIDRVLAKIG